MLAVLSQIFLVLSITSSSVWRSPGKRATLAGKRKLWAILALACDANADLPGAIDCYQQQLSIARAHKDDRIERSALKSLKLAYKYLADYEKADEYRQQQLAIVRQLFLTDKNKNFVELAETVGLNLTEDFAGADLSGFDLHYADFNGADLRET